MYYPYYYDPTYIILIPAIILTMYAQFKVSSTTNRYFRVRTQRGYTGEQTAREILNANGIYDVRIEMTRGTLSDHYDPRNKVLRLSQDVYRGTSITSVAVAAHECGHAIQHARGYAPLTIRGAIVPVVNFVSYLGYLGLLISIVGGLTGYIKLSIIILLATVLFQLVTLPVEIDASKRALVQLEELNLVYNDENKSAKKVLSAAAMTYIASLLSSILDLLRLILILNSRNDDRR